MSSETSSSTSPEPGRLSPNPEKPRRRAERLTALIEAALYVTGRPIDLKTLASITRAKSDDKLKKAAAELAQYYKERQGAIEILGLSDGRYVMQLRPEFVKDVKKLATRPLLTLGPLKTLSFIALKQPVTQSYVVRVRGKLAYKHVRQLNEMGLIRGEKSGRTRVLRTSDVFSDYFNLSPDLHLMKKQLRQMLARQEPHSLPEKPAEKEVEA